jgi:hypothetical protein
MELLRHVYESLVFTAKFSLAFLGLLTTIAFVVIILSAMEFSLRSGVDTSQRMVALFFLLIVGIAVKLIIGWYF